VENHAVQLITGMSVHVEIARSYRGCENGSVESERRIWEVVDLPGSYSLLGKNADEQVTSSFLLSQEYDVILNVVDSTSLERSLMLTLELLTYRSL